MPAKPLTPDQLKDAARLHAIFLQRQKEAKKLNKKLSQEDLASVCGWKTQAAVSHYFKGKIPLNLYAAQKFAAALEVSIRDFSPSLAQVVEDMARQNAGSATEQQILVKELSQRALHNAALFDEIPTEDGKASIESMLKALGVVDKDLSPNLPPQPHIAKPAKKRASGSGSS